MLFFECSAKDKTNVDKIFREVLKKFPSCEQKNHARFQFDMVIKSESDQHQKTIKQGNKALTLLQLSIKAIPKNGMYNDHVTEYIALLDLAKTKAEQANNSKISNEGEHTLYGPIVRQMRK